MQQESQDKRSSPRKRVAGIITHLSTFLTCSPQKQLAGTITHLSTFLTCFRVIDILHSSFIKLIQNIKITPDNKLATNYSYLQGLPL
mgnify:CR=1 FL=1